MKYPATKIMRSHLWVFLSLSSYAFSQGPVHEIPDPGVITTHQEITPAGGVSIFQGRVHALSFCGTDSILTAVVQKLADLESIT